MPGRKRTIWQSRAARARPDSRQRHVGKRREREQLMNIAAVSRKASAARAAIPVGGAEPGRSQPQEGRGSSEHGEKMKLESEEGRKGEEANSAAASTSATVASTIQQCPLHSPLYPASSPRLRPRRLFVDRGAGLRNVVSS